jgi:ferrous iron transport protein B
MVAVRTPTVALVGNPNTGKTTLFNALAGMHQRVGNYPGVTVETKKGRLRHATLILDLIDLPGTYSLAPRSIDEMLAVNVILGLTPDEPRPDVVVTIADASNLERNLYLMTQVRELGVPVILALNMMDTAESQGLRIDVDKLSQQLGVPVVPMQANKGRGVEQLKSVIAKVLEHDAGCCASQCGLVFPEAFENEVQHMHEFLNNDEPRFLLRRLLLDVGGETEKRLAQKHGPGLTEEVKAARQRLTQGGFVLAGIEARIRYGWIRQAVAGCIHRPLKRVVTWTDHLDKILTHKILGTLIFLVVMFLVFTSIFVLADWPMKWIGDGFKMLGVWAGSFLAAGPLRSLIVDGMINGVGAVVKFVPQIIILFALIAILEDCGYMARAAFLMDRLMSRAGLNGKSFIPLLSSVACAVPGIMSARVIENRRDRLATILVAPLMSCSARLPVYGLLVGALLPGSVWIKGLAYFGLYMIGFLLAPLAALVLKRTLLRGETPVFVMEMPLYKFPSLHTVLRRALESGWMFLKRAGTLILASMVIVWAALYFPSGTYEEQIAALEAKLAKPRADIEILKTALEQGADPHETAAKINEIKEAAEPDEKEINKLNSDWKAQSILGRVGKWIEPVVEPLGWDWRIGMAALASFPAREVIVMTLGIIFGEGEGELDDQEYRDSLTAAVRAAHWPDDRPLFTIPVAFSVMVFFALCSQCVSTLVVIKRETNSWGWPVFTFVYMTVLAYVGAFLTYQIGSLL